MFTFIWIRAGPFPRGVVPFPLMGSVFFYHHKTSRHSHLPLGRTIQPVSTAAPPQHREGHVTLECAKRLRCVGNIEPQACACAQIEEAMPGDPLPQHAARWLFAVLQHQVRAIHCDAAFEWLTLQNKQTLFWKRMVVRRRRWHEQKRWNGETEEWRREEEEEVRNWGACVERWWWIGRLWAKSDKLIQYGKSPQLATEVFKEYFSISPLWCGGRMKAWRKTFAFQTIKWKWDWITKQRASTYMHDFASV